MLESRFQSQVRRRICEILGDDCVVLKTDSSQIQGFPDLLILYKGRYALLETKRGKGSPRQANQAYYIEWARKDAYASFVSPENFEEVLDELEKALRA